MPPPYIQPAGPAYAAPLQPACWAGLCRPATASLLGRPTPPRYSQRADASPLATANLLGRPMPPRYSQPAGPANAPRYSLPASSACASASAVAATAVSSRGAGCVSWTFFAGLPLVLLCRGGSGCASSTSTCTTKQARGGGGLFGGAGQPRVGEAVFEGRVCGGGWAAYSRRSSVLGPCVGGGWAA